MFSLSCSLKKSSRFSVPMWFSMVSYTHPHPKVERERRREIVHVASRILVGMFGFFFIGRVSAGTSRFLLGSGLQRSQSGCTQGAPAEDRGNIVIKSFEINAIYRIWISQPPDHQLQ